MGNSQREHPSPDLWSGSGNDEVFFWIRDNSGWAKTKELLSQIWEEYLPFCPDKPSKFIHNFSTHIYGQAFAMILTVLLQRKTGKVRKGKREKGVDIIIENETSTVAIECVVPRLGCGGDRVEPNSSQPFITADDKENVISIRLLDALNNKATEISSYLESDLIKPTDYKAIAICGAELQRGSITSMENFAHKVSYGLQGKFPPFGERTSIIRSNGKAEVGGFFTNQMNDHIDMVLFYPYSPWQMLAGEYNHIFVYPRNSEAIWLNKHLETESQPTKCSPLVIETLEVLGYGE